MEVFASYGCGLRSIRGLSVTFGLSFWLVLVLAPKGFSPVLQFSSLHKNQHSKFHFDLETAGKKSHLMECPLLSFLFYFDSQIEVSVLICRDTSLFSLYSISDSLNIVIVVNHHVL